MSVTSDQPVNWSITQGENFMLEIQYQDPDGNAIDISDINIVMQVRDRPGGDVLCASLSMNEGIVVSDPTTGVIEINVSSAQTENFNYPRSSYEILGTDQYNEKILFLKGWFEVDAGTVR